MIGCRIRGVGNAAAIAQIEAIERAIVQRYADAEREREQAIRRRGSLGYAIQAMVSTVETRACMSLRRGLVTPNL